MKVCILIFRNVLFFEGRGCAVMPFFFPSFTKYEFSFSHLKYCVHLLSWKLIISWFSEVVNKIYLSWFAFGENLCATHDLRGLMANYSYFIVPDEIQLSARALEETSLFHISPGERKDIEPHVPQTTDWMFVYCDIFCFFCCCF